MLARSVTIPWADIENLLRLRALWYVDYGAGRRVGDLGSVFSLVSGLGDPDTVRKWVMAARAADCGRSASRLLVSLYMAASLREAETQVALTELRPAIRWGAEDLNLRQALVVARSTDDPELRRRVAETEAALASAYLVRARCAVAALSAIGLEGVGGWLGVLHSADPGRVSDWCRDLLVATAEPYRRLLRRTNVNDPANLPRILEELGGGAPTEPLRMASRLVSRAGFDPRAGGRIYYDLGVEECRFGRAYYVPVEIPGRVVLAARVFPGLAGLIALLHEMGHALHLAHVRPGLPVYDRYGIDPSVTESSAFLFEDLVGEVCSSAELLRLARLLVLRRHCALTLFALAAYNCFTAASDVSAEGLSHHHAELLATAVGPAGTSPGVWARALDVDWRSLAYVRGLMLWAGLRRSVCADRLDRSWLVSLWARGGQVGCGDLVDEDLAVGQLAEMMTEEVC